VNKEIRVLRWSRSKEPQTSWSALYIATDEHGEAGDVSRTGRYGSDDYPWDWHITPLHAPPEGVRVRNSGSADTLRSAKDQAEQAARLTRDTKRAWRS